MTTDLVVIANFIACNAIAWASICRLNASSKCVRRSERLKYALMMGAACASALQGPLFGEQAGRTDLVFSTVVVAYLLLGMHRWKAGPPPDTLDTLMMEKQDGHQDHAH